MGTGASRPPWTRYRREAGARGDRAYRDLLVEAGAIGQRVYLAAEALGLAARNLAAFWDDELNALLAISPPGRAVLHLTLLGREGPAHPPARDAVGLRQRVDRHGQLLHSG